MTIRRILIILLALYTLLIAYIETNIALGRGISPYLTPLSTLVGFSFALVHAGQRMGWNRTLGLLACVFVISLTFESVGVATGLVYGPYHYSLKLGPLFLGLVPFLIPLAWFMMMYPSFVIADWLVPVQKHLQRILTVAAVGGLVMTAWDLVMDPVMVRGGHWIWEVNGAYFGIPLQNFWGWWLTTFVTFMVFLSFNPSLPRPSDSNNDRLAVLSYATTGLGNTLGALLVGLGGPALVGFFSITPWAVIGWLNLSSKASK
jgi:uncharacterized membrane protein